MPTSTAWVEPEVFLTHGNVTVYHTYRDDDVAQGTQTFWYTTSSTSDDEHFDVRDVQVPSAALLKNRPPFLAADCNPAFATATNEQKAEWQRQWTEWNMEGGGQDQAIMAILKEGIDLGLISAED
ncbi:hypothetical protein DEE93_16540 [Ralstonia pickettii]|uniref:Uncharacterized protein n=3 Tax=Pseudomonadota TaxID=1224 RepID=A0AAW4Q6U7_RALPI|nr:hypothetical protein [Ralstonia pickettii]MBA9851948.1 hypothetical protein [Ralstonia pickettii]MBA9919695.1 hypothetical protein [Ralstonia pickettii]MBA9958901.1 hypothetical protein [Ralstonia pickettii]MBA9965090.1 hypothetical protein [Ralstonia pickettii]